MRLAIFSGATLHVGQRPVSDARSFGQRDILIHKSASHSAGSDVRPHGHADEPFLLIRYLDNIFSYERILCLNPDCCCAQMSFRGVFSPEQLARSTPV